MNGYNVKRYDVPVKRFCQTLELKNDPELIDAYRKIHSEENMWQYSRNVPREQARMRNGR